MQPSETRASAAGAAAAERTLVRAVQQRDRKAMAEFVAAHADAVYAYLSRRLYPRSESVEDLVQDVFVSALESLAQFKGDSGLRSWLIGIARHKVQDYYRDRLREADWGEVDSEPAMPAPFDDWLHEKRLAERVRPVLASLTEAYRCALLWRYWEKCSTAEMARRAGRTAKAMERLLARARDEFRRRWSGE